MNVPKSSDYRSRIYQYYVNARQQSLVPKTIQGLKPRGPMLRKIIGKHFPEDKRASILDLGCGHGAFMHFIREAGFTDVIGVDSSPEQVEEAKRLGIEGVFQGDLMETLRELPSGSKEVIICFDVIEHFNKQEVLPFVDEVHRILRQGGKWILHTPNGESPFGGRMLFGDFTHEMAYTRTSITQLLMSSGFSDVACLEDTPVPHGIKSAMRWFLWKCVRSALRLYLAAETGAGERECILTQNFLTVTIK